MADASSKKRKRESNGINTSNKKTANVNGSTTITIKHIDSTGLCPTVVSSRGVNVPPLPFKAYAKPYPDTKTSSVRPKSHSVILRSSDHPRLDYIASPAPSELSHYVAIYDPSTHELSIAPAHHTQLQAVLRIDVTTDASPKKSNREQRIELGQEFGTKKAKKMIASRTINAITNGSTDKRASEVQGAILDAVAEQAGEEPDKAHELETALRAKPIPMPALSAAVVEEVYPLKELIPSQDLRLIQVQEWQRKARADEAIQFHHRYPAYHVADIGKSQNTTKLKALSYLALLLQFNDALKPAGKSSKKVPKKEILVSKMTGYPDALIDSVRRRFSDSNELTQWHIQKLHTTMCALSLYIDDFTTNTSWLRDDLRLDNKTISQYFQELGCKVRAMSEKERANDNLTKAEAAMVRVAVLKLPLEFPKLRSGRRR